MSGPLPEQTRDYIVPMLRYQDGEHISGVRWVTEGFRSLSGDRYHEQDRIKIARPCEECSIAEGFILRPVQLDDWVRVAKTIIKMLVEPNLVGLSPVLEFVGEGVDTRGTLGVRLGIGCPLDAIYWHLADLIAKKMGFGRCDYCHEYIAITDGRVKYCQPSPREKADAKGMDTKAESRCMKLAHYANVTKPQRQEGAAALKKKRLDG